MAVYRGLLGKIYTKFVRKFYLNDLWTDLCLRAKRESVEYIAAHMQGAQVCDDRFALLRFCAERCPRDGLILEFGVEKGLSINCLAESTQRTVHGFDSFQGLPHDWRGTKETRGKFAMGGKPPRVRDNVRLHIGWFDDTMSEFLRANAGPVALLHVDCDIYESTRSIFNGIGDRLIPGTWIVFDEYFNYPGWQLHEYKAFQEWIAATGRAYEYVGFSAEKGHVAVRLA